MLEVLHDKGLVTLHARERILCGRRRSFHVEALTVWAGAAVEEAEPVDEIEDEEEEGKEQEEENV